MNIEDFKKSITQDHPPEGLSPLLLSLWYDAKCDWEKSHDIISEIESKDAALIHAYLHRKEGDLWNADYWYLRAGKARNNESLPAEWNELVENIIVSRISDISTDFDS
ncbi:MAG TPA: hypothetical protein VMZ69_00410 [Saprospiraceae bacterium]|nr:hypothetical protein [Saprospiraceae bacterium]